MTANKTELPKWIEEIRHPNSTPKRFVVDETWKIYEALSIAVKALEIISRRGDGIKPGLVDYKNCLAISKAECKDALRRIEELGK